MCDIWDCLICESVIRLQEEHAVALSLLPHGLTWAVPEAVLHLGGGIVVVPARAQGSAELHLMDGEALEHRSCDLGIHAEFCFGVGGIFDREFPHALQIFQELGLGISPDVVWLLWVECLELCFLLIMNNCLDDIGNLLGFIDGVISDYRLH